MPGRHGWGLNALGVRYPVHPFEERLDTLVQAPMFERQDDEEFELTHLTCVGGCGLTFQVDYPQYRSANAWEIMTPCPYCGQYQRRPGMTRLRMARILRKLDKDLGITYEQS